MRKSADLKKKKSLVSAPPISMSHLLIFFKKFGRLPQIPESVAVGGNRWEKSFGGN